MDKKILILGSTGMLGSMVLNYLFKKGLNISAPLREDLDKVCYGDYDYIINCIGVTSQKLKSPAEAILANSLMPHSISREAPKSKIIQIATDCVFSGKDGFYMEGDEHDASDIYGKTKSLGEVQAKNFYNIRTSIVGIFSKVSLLGWFVSQKKNATVDGYIDHYWNGITTLHFAKLCYAIIKKKRKIPNNLHFTPFDVVTKYELLKIFAEKFGRKDIDIRPVKAGECNRILSTKHIDVTDRLWDDMGYKGRVWTKDMIEELANYEL